MSTGNVPIDRSASQVGLLEKIVKSEGQIHRHLTQGVALPGRCHLLSTIYSLFLGFAEDPQAFRWVEYHVVLVKTPMLSKNIPVMVSSIRNSGGAIPNFCMFELPIVDGDPPNWSMFDESPGLGCP